MVADSIRHNPGLDTLQSAKQRHLLDTIDKLRNCGLDSELSLPQLVVCGDQSSGKLSTTQALQPNDDENTYLMPDRKEQRSRSTDGNRISSCRRSMHTVCDRDYLTSCSYGVTVSQDQPGQRADPHRTESHRSIQLLYQRLFQLDH